ncbi:glutaminyl-peptide cyclotransferase [Chromatium okenii]|uniref:glutaminyl-peptide cyclotransferase n=1 Tax=Chromatium okenii TaxID=61644 RepID=UPI001F5B2F81|nr:glutaminyl-peptide cyclotransferase [Chromatium okenii]
MREYFIALLMLYTAIAAPETRITAPIYGVRVVATFPHDPAAFTQGLVMVNGQLFESIGLYGKSALRRVDLRSGRVAQETRLAANVFCRRAHRVARATGATDLARKHRADLRPRAASTD